MPEKLLYLKNALASKWINLRGKKDYPFKSILIVKLDEIGDLVTALNVFYNLHKQYPNATIDVLCKPFNSVFFKHTLYVRVIEELEKDYDLIVELRGDEKTLQYALSHPPKYRVDRGLVRLTNKLKGKQTNELVTNANIIENLVTGNSLDNTIQISDQELDKVESFLQMEGITKFVIIHLGARDAARRWPAERYAQLITYINEEYNLPCILVGGPDDDEINKSCLNLVTSKINVNVVGEFNLLEYAALCTKATLFVGNESGPLHIAAAMKTPTVALFGPGVKDVFYPIGNDVRIHHYFLARGHKQQTTANSTIFSIAVDEVKKSVDSFLNKKGSS